MDASSERRGITLLFAGTQVQVGEEKEYLYGFLVSE
jgi:hypothetical protein